MCRLLLSLTESVAKSGRCALHTVVCRDTFEFATFCVMLIQKYCFVLQKCIFKSMHFQFIVYGYCFSRHHHQHLQTFVWLLLNTIYCWRITLVYLGWQWFARCLSKILKGHTHSSMRPDFHTIERTISVAPSVLYILSMASSDTLDVAVDALITVVCLAPAGMNIFVAFFLLLLLLADSTPPAASRVPLIGRCPRHAPHKRAVSARAPLLRVVVVRILYVIFNTFTKSPFTQAISCLNDRAT